MTLYTMAYTEVKSCPLTFQDWSSRASSTCSSNVYHCVRDEYSRIVEVCTEAIWIEQGIILWTLYFKQNIHILVVLYNQVRVSEIRDSLKVTGEDIARKTGCVLIFPLDKSYYNQCINICIIIEYKRIFIQYKWKRPNIATFDVPYNLHIAFSSLEDKGVSSFKGCAFKKQNKKSTFFLHTILVKNNQYDMSLYDFYHTDTGCQPFAVGYVLKTLKLLDPI